jgi:hypothetical protein
MALTQIDNVAALVVIDMQKGIVAMPTVHPASEIIDRVARLARLPRAQPAGRSRQRGRGIVKLV